MADGASLGMMHVRLAISPAWGGGQRLLRLAGYARTLEWLAAGKVLLPGEAFQAGLVSRVTGRGQALAEARAIATSFSANDPEAVKAAKRIAVAGIGHPPAEAQQIERRLFPDLWAGDAHRAASADFVARRNHRPHPVDVPHT
jgi:enoyl-CoA hydratase/carnithine racemase